MNSYNGLAVTTSGINIVAIINAKAILIPFVVKRENPYAAIAQWRRERLTEKQKDYTILDGVKGKGHYVGTYIALTRSHGTPYMLSRSGSCTMETERT